jgi:hypothetical protein
MGVALRLEALCKRNSLSSSDFSWSRKNLEGDVPLPSGMGPGLAGDTETECLPPAVTLSSCVLLPQPRAEKPDWGQTQTGRWEQNKRPRLQHRRGEPA